jgi:hypothetical protein
MNLVIMQFSPACLHFVLGRCAQDSSTRAVHCSSLRTGCVEPTPPPPYRSRQIICLCHSESDRLPLHLPMRPSSHQLHAGPFHPVHACTAQQNIIAHCALCTACAPLVLGLTTVNPRYNVLMGGGGGGAVNPVFPKSPVTWYSRK